MSVSGTAPGPVPPPPPPPPPPPSSSSSSTCRSSSLLPLLLRGAGSASGSPNNSSGYCSPVYESSPDTIDILRAETRVLVVGAGGLGCEILKNLSLSCVRDIHVIDLDTVDVSNLNRQFLFRADDCEKPKAQVAAQRIQARQPLAKVTWHCKPVQEFSSSWYKQFDCVIAGLDNIEARQWINATLVNLVEFDEEGGIDMATVIPLIDGGTEGFAGQARLFIPRVTSCFECSLASLPATQTSYPVCTIRNVPRIPEHCIVYALKVEWPMLTHFSSSTDYQLYTKTSPLDEHIPSVVPLDKDNTEHMTWLFSRASARAAEFGISGVTYSLTMQVVKNIIPAIASTNALIAAACVNECWKIRTASSLLLDNYFMYMGGLSTGTNTETIQYQKNPECAVCAMPKVYHLPRDVSLTVQDFLSRVETEFSLDRPSLSLAGQTIYLTSLHDDYQHNLTQPLYSFNDKAARAIAVLNDKKGQTLKLILVD